MILPSLPDPLPQDVGFSILAKGLCILDRTQPFHQYVTTKWLLVIALRRIHHEVDFSPRARQLYDAALSKLN